MNLQGKTAVITGASDGIGKEVCLKLAKDGVSLALIARNENKLADIQNEAKKLGSPLVNIYSTDLSEIKNVFELSEKLNKDFDQLDLLINCAGIGIYKPIEEVAYEEWQQSLAVGVTAPYFLTQKLLSLLDKSDTPLVLNLGSGAGVIPMAGRSVYCTTKFALRGATLSLAEEFKRTKTKFCLITLGSTLTNFGPLTLEEKKREQLEGKAYFSAEWVGNKIAEIIKDENREIEYKLFPGDYGLGEWHAPDPK